MAALFNGLYQEISRGLHNLLESFVHCLIMEHTLSLVHQDDNSFLGLLSNSKSILERVFMEVGLSCSTHSERERFRRLMRIIS